MKYFSFDPSGRPSFLRLETLFSKYLFQKDTFGSVDIVRMFTLRHIYHYYYLRPSATCCYAFPHRLGEIEKINKIFIRYKYFYYDIYIYLLFLEKDLPAGFPVITEGPGNTKSIEVGHNAVLQCTATGNPQPTIYWLRENMRLDLDTNPRYSILDKGFPGMYHYIYMFKRVFFADEGFFFDILGHPLRNV